MKAPAIAPPVRCSPLFSLVSQPARSAPLSAGTGSALGGGATGAGGAAIGAAAGGAASVDTDMGAVGGRTEGADGEIEGAGVGAAGAAAGSATFLPKKSSPTSAFSQSSLPRLRVPAGSDGGASISPTGWGDGLAAGAGDAAGGAPEAGFFLKKLNMEDRSHR